MECVRVGISSEGTRLKDEQTAPAWTVAFSAASPPRGDVRTPAAVRRLHPCLRRLVCHGFESYGRRARRGMIRSTMRRVEHS